MPKTPALVAKLVCKGGPLDLLEELGIADETLVIFTSDNGPTFNGGSDSKFFDSAHGMRGLKCSVHEGGIRVPFRRRTTWNDGQQQSETLFSDWQPR